MFERSAIKETPVAVEFCSWQVNLWLWSFARGKPRLGGLSVEQTFERQVEANEASKERAAENRRRRKADKA